MENQEYKTDMELFELIRANVNSLTNGEISPEDCIENIASTLETLKERY